MRTVSNKKNWKITLTILLGLFLICQGNAQVKSGLYSNCLIFSVNQESNQVSGYLWRYIYNDDNPKLGIYQTCYLFFKGQYKNLHDTINIYDYFDQMPIAKGNLLCNGNKIFFQTGSSIISCMNTFDFQDGESFELTKSISIMFCSRIKISKSFFYKEKRKTNEYLTKGDFVSILDIMNDLYLVQYIDNTGKTIEGWIKKSDVE